MKSFFNLKSFLLLSFISFFSVCATAQENKSNYLFFKNHKQLHEFFRYKEGGDIIVSGHRGGREKGYPENSIEGFQNVLNQMPAFFEIDPRLTKDSIVVLMHDETLDRTTTSKGKVSDYTWAQLQDVRLKDSQGNITDSKIPTLEESIIWAKGKTVVNLDKKDVPLAMIASLIKKHKAQNYVMITVHTGAQAVYYNKRFPTIMFSVFARNDKEYEDMEVSEVPWGNMIAYVGHSITSQNLHIVNKLRQHGVRCMISVAPSHDRVEIDVDRYRKYQEEIDTRPDIIESDFPTDVWKLIDNKKE